MLYVVSVEPTSANTSNKLTEIDIYFIIFGSGRCVVEIHVHFLPN